MDISIFDIFLIFFLSFFFIFSIIFPFFSFWMGLNGNLLVIGSSLVAYTLSLYVYIHEEFIILSCYLNYGLT